MTPSIPVFPNKINALGDFRGGVKVARDFAPVAERERTVLAHWVRNWVEKVRRKPAMQSFTVKLLTTPCRMA
jgi:hypothetical protein